MPGECRVPVRPVPVHPVPFPIPVRPVPVQVGSGFRFRFRFWDFMYLIEDPVRGYRRPTFGVRRFGLGRSFKNDALWPKVSCESLCGFCSRLCPGQVLGFS